MDGLRQRILSLISWIMVQSGIVDRNLAVTLALHIVGPVFESWQCHKNNLRKESVALNSKFTRFVYILSIDQICCDNIAYLYSSEK